MSTIKRRITTGAVATGIAAAAIGGTVAASPEAAANVPNGKYTMYDNTGRAPATISRGVLAIRNPGGVLRYRIHQTRNGGYVDIGITRYVLTRHGNTYSGPIMLGPLQIGQTKLVPR